MGASDLKFFFEHRFTQKHLSTYLDGRLSPRARRRVERHLAVCPKCARELETLRATVELLHRVEPQALPRSFLLPASVVEEQKRYRRLDATYSFLQGATVAVALLLIFFISGDVLLSMGFLPMGSSSPALESKALSPQEAPALPQLVRAPESSLVSTPTVLSTAAEPKAIVPIRNAQGAESLPSPPTTVRGGSSPLPKTFGARPAAGEAVSLSEELTEARSISPSPVHTLPSTPMARALPTMLIASPPPTAQALRVESPPSPIEASREETLPFWKLWGLLRLTALVLSGLLLMLLGTLLWIGQRRRL